MPIPFVRQSAPEFLLPVPASCFTFELVPRALGIRYAIDCMQLDRSQIEEFQAIVWDYYAHNARRMPWRDVPTPYHVLVSEIMLQQTQVNRVLPKFQAFIARFPDVASLAAAPLGDVLREWNGLGYNRRAKFLHQAAQAVAQEYEGTLPDQLDLLVKLPGIGKNTAGAVLAYAYERPVVFVETNIRTVYFRHFLEGHERIDDKEVIALLEQTIDREQPREWYWALMDYGSYLKQHHGNNITLSKHYTKQSAFAGSLRQLRGQVLKLLLQAPMTHKQLDEKFADARLETLLQELERDGLIHRADGFYHAG